MNKIKMMMFVTFFLCMGQDTPAPEGCSTHRGSGDAVDVLCRFVLGESLPAPYHVSGCISHWDPATHENIYDHLNVAEDAFLTYREAHDYVRNISRQYPTAVFGLDRVVNYDTDPGIVRLDLPLTEADTLEWWMNGRVTIRTFPVSRSCGDAVAVRSRIMQRRCLD